LDCTESWNRGCILHHGSIPSCRLVRIGHEVQQTFNSHRRSLSLTGSVKDGFWRHDVQEETVLSCCGIYRRGRWEGWNLVASRDVESGGTIHKPVVTVDKPCWRDLVTAYTLGAIVERLAGVVCNDSRRDRCREP
jgi:hypothetical protein